MVGVASLCALLQYFALYCGMLGHALEAHAMTKGLLDTLLGFRPLPTSDENECTRSERWATLARLCNSFATKATLIRKIVRIDLGHTI
jgi:hypothetical protein